MPATYDSIQTVTVSGGATSTVTFNPIGGTYTDLILVIRPSAANSYLYYRYNNDASALYSSIGFSGNVTNAVGGRNGNIAKGYMNFNTGMNQYSGYILEFMNYSSTQTSKTVMTRGTSATPGSTAVDVEFSTWQSTAAVTRIDIIANSSVISDGTVLALFGIKRA